RIATAARKKIFEQEDLREGDPAPRADLVQKNDCRALRKGCRTCRGRPSTWYPPSQKLGFARCFPSASPTLADGREFGCKRSSKLEQGGSNPPTPDLGKGVVARGSQSARFGAGNDLFRASFAPE